MRHPVLLRLGGARLSAEAEALGIAEGEGRQAFGGDCLRAVDGSGKRLAREVALCGPGKVVVPHVAESGIETDAFEAMIETDGPAVLAGESWEGDLGEVLEVGDGGCLRRHSDGFFVRDGGTWVCLSGACRRRTADPYRLTTKKETAPARVLEGQCR